MKKLGILLALICGTAGAGFAQNKIDQESKDNAKSFLPGGQFQQSLPLQLKTPESLLIDSTHLFIPRSLYTEKLLSLPNGTKFRVGLPFFELPDPQSRMPIREFDDSVNYTILEKEY